MLEFMTEDRSPREPGRGYVFADFPESLLLFAAFSRVPPPR